MLTAAMASSLTLGLEEPAWTVPVSGGDPFAGTAALLLALTLLHLALRGLDRLGWITYDGRRLRRGLAGAAVAFNAIFQPHASEPDIEQKMHVRARDENQNEATDDEPPAVARDVENFPDDGLRG